MNILGRQQKIYFNSDIIRSATQVLGSQILIKVLGLVLSIILLRFLPKEQYAVYTVLLTIQSMLIPLSNSSIFTGFKKIAGEVWLDDRKMSALIATATQMSHYIIAIAFIFISGYGGYILIKQNVSYSNIAFFLTCILLTVIPEVYTSFLRSAFLIQKKVLTTQITELSSPALRFFVIVSLLFLFKKDLSVNSIVLITMCSTWLSYFYIRYKSNYLRRANPSVDSNFKTTIFKYIKLNWLNSLFFVFKSQITIFLIGVLGTTSSLADLGALTRIGLIFTVFISLIQNIYGPAFGRCYDKEKMLAMFNKIILAILSFSSIVLIAVYFSPQYFLWILGPDYEHLAKELFLVVVVAILNLLLATVYSINQYKGWIKYTPLWEIPTEIVVLIGCIFLFDISTLTGALYLSIASATTSLLLHFSNSFAGFTKYDKQAPIDNNSISI